SDDTYAQEIPPDDDRFETDEDPFPRGSRVRHLEYGEGEVLRTSGFGRLRRVTIRFDEVGEKQFLAAYVALERIL
ncbi:MAG TPA: hypothetical protein VK116_14685, partial [Planctomycetota bacterium]|nr:hypothetical protein [Planctomycetota bacterium]